MGPLKRNIYPFITLERFAWLVMILSIALGLYFRLKGLGTWPFTNDEFYLAQSVQSILANGLPSFECGGYYVRGILYQYLMAPLIATGLPQELTLRLVPVICYLLALPPLYRLSQKVSGRLIASLVVILFSLSVLEIEISRFARMYMPFQALFIWYLLFLYEVVIERRESAFRWLYILSAVGVFIWEGGIFLVLLNFLPLLYRSGRHLAWYMLLSILMLVGAYLYLSFDFRHYPAGMESAWPPELDLATTGRDKLYKPNVLLPLLTSHPLWLILGCILLVAIGWISWILCHKETAGYHAFLCLGLAIAFAFFNQFTLTLMVLLIGVLMGWLPTSLLRTRKFIVLAGGLVTFALFWMAFGFTAGTWPAVAELSDDEKLLQTLFSKLDEAPFWFIEIVRAGVTLFYFPHGLFRALYEWVSLYPVLISTLLILTGLGIIWTLSFYKNVQAQSYGLLAGVLLILLLAEGMLTVGGATRYTFFLYPLLLLLALGAAYRIGEWLPKIHRYAGLTVSFLMATLMLSSEDFNSYHLRHIDSYEVNFRMIYADQPKKVSGYILRRDFRSVAELLNREALPDDIVISTSETISHYTDRIDYLFFMSGQREFASYTACAGTKARWSNANLLYRENQLHEVVKQAMPTVWLVVNRQSPRPDEIKLLEHYEQYLYFTARDDILSVLKIPAKSGASAVSSQQHH